MNHRRKSLIVLGAGALVWTGAVLGQSKKPPVVIGWVSLRSREAGGSRVAALKEGMAALGWKEGANFMLEERWADGQANRLPSFAKELAAKKPALIIADGGRAASDVVNWVRNLPIVMVTTSDPVAAGLVASLARPGGMVTGVSGFSIELTEKQVEFLLAAAPKVKRVGFLGSSSNPLHPKLMETARRAIARHAVEARFAEAGNPEDIEPALSQLAQDGVQALVILAAAVLSQALPRIMKFALAQRWPVVSGTGVPAAGGLLGYGQSARADFRRAAYYVDRILKGAKPGDLPIEQPTTFDLVINMKTAKALGLTIPQSVLAQATRVIE